MISLVSSPEKAWFSERSPFGNNSLSTFKENFQASHVGRELSIGTYWAQSQIHSSSNPALKEQGHHFMTNFGVLLFIIYQEIFIFILYLLVKILLERINNQSRT